MEEVPQPFETVTRIGYKHNLHHLPTEFFCRRSDILVSSTLSFTLCPVEQSTYVKKNFADLTDEEIYEWTNLRHKFLARHIKHTELRKPKFMPGYYTSPIRNTFKKPEHAYQNSAVPMDIENGPKKANVFVS